MSKCENSIQGQSKVLCGHFKERYSCECHHTIETCPIIKKDQESHPIGQEVHVVDMDVDFNGTVDSYRGGYIVVIDMEDDAFSINPRSLNLN